MDENKTHIEQYLENKKPSAGVRLAIMEIEELLCKKGLTVKEHRQIFKILSERLEKNVEDLTITLKEN